MNEKMRKLRKISELDFALHELTLFLDTHPTSARALELKREYRHRRDKAVAEYEAEYGPLNRTANSTELTDRWKWIDGPWPWEYQVKED